MPKAVVWVTWDPGRGSPHLISGHPFKGEVGEAAPGRGRTFGRVCNELGGQVNRLSLLPALSLHTVELVGTRGRRPRQGQLASLTQKGLEKPTGLDGVILQFMHSGGQEG